MYSASSPSQKIGTDTPISVNTRTVWSSQPSLRIAAMRPSPTPTMLAMTIAVSASSAVAGA